MRGAREEGQDRVLVSCFRTDATNCKFPKVPRPFALSTAELYEGPSQGYRRRHLPAAAAARPDGTPAEPSGCRHFRRRGRRRRGLLAKPGEEKGTFRPCLRGSSEGWRRMVGGEKPEEKGEGGAESCCGNVRVTGQEAAGGGAEGRRGPFPGHPWAGGRGQVPF